MNQYIFIPNENSNRRRNHSITIYEKTEEDANRIMNNVTNGEYFLCATIKKNNDDEWFEHFPKEIGNYWFYGTRNDLYGWEPKLGSVEIFKSGNNYLICVLDGGFLFEEEIKGRYWFKKRELPELPKF